MYGEREYKSSLGHICTGGGASISNSPVNVTINIYVGGTSPSIVNKIKQAVGGLFGNETKNIEIPAGISDRELQGCVVRQLES